MDQEPQNQAPSSASSSFENQPKPLAKLLAVLLIIVITYLVGFQNGRKGYIFVPKEFKIVNQSSQPQTVDYQLLWDAINVLNTKYIDKPVDQQKILYGAVQGAISAVGDPYTTFFPPQDLTNFKTSLQGSFEGIGAEVGMQDGLIVIMATLDESPAKKAGLLPKDAILDVDGQSTANWSVDQAVNKIRGPKGTQVTLTLGRQGKDKPFDVKITRETIQIKSVKWQYRDIVANGKTKHIAVITVSEFGDDTKPLFDQAVNDIFKHSIDGIVLDLRNNPGGYLQTAVDVASNWLTAGQTVVTEAHSDGTSQEYKAEGGNRLNVIKTVVLINGGSASAAEILAGALHDYNIGELIGEKSFGKGSVQELVDLKGGSAVKVTVAKWITPGGKNLNHNGLDPDVAVKLTPDDASKDLDPQMDKALLEVTK